MIPIAAGPYVGPPARRRLTRGLAVGLAAALALGVAPFLISQNDRGRLININYGFEEVLIYNNVFHIAEDLSPIILFERPWHTWTDSSTVTRRVTPSRTTSSTT